MKKGFFQVGLIVLLASLLVGGILVNKLNFNSSEAATGTFTCTQANAGSACRLGYGGVSGNWDGKSCVLNICPNGDTDGNKACSTLDRGAIVTYGNCFTQIQPQVVTLKANKTCYQYDTVVSATNNQWCDLALPENSCQGYEDNLATCVVKTPSPSPTASPRPTATPVKTATPTARPTPTATPTKSPSPTPTRSPSPTPVSTKTPTPTPVKTATPTPTPVKTASPTPTVSPTPTITPLAKSYLRICKYKDENGNGYKDGEDGGISWNFDYEFDGTTYQIENSWWRVWDKGCVKVEVPIAKHVVVSEEGKSGWELTGIYADSSKQSGGNYIYDSESGKTKEVWFLNKVNPSATPVVGEPNSCNGTCGSNSNCQSALYCYKGYCRNPQNPESTSCNNPEVLGTVAPPPVLPKTGNNIYLDLAGFATLAVSGFFIYKKFKLV
jgi:hypothetical protein